MRLVYDPVREHFLKPIIAAEPYVEGLVETVADIRMSVQKKTLGWAESYYDWTRRVWRRHPPGEAIMFEEDWADNVVRSAMLIGLPLSYVPFGMVTVGSYISPWTAAVAAPLDAWNIYRYFSQ